MKKYVIAYMFILAFTFFWWFNFVRPYEDLSEHICRDYDTAAYITKAYQSNTKELTRFNYKRTQDCKKLLKVYGENKGLLDQWKKCGVLDATFASVVPLTKQLVNYYGDSESARTEIVSVLELIQPFSYCPQYGYVNKTLDEFKTKLGL